jgi:hypothetical protein
MDVSPQAGGTDGLSERAQRLGLAVEDYEDAFH